MKKILAKFTQAKGLQRSSSNKQKVQPGGDLPINARISNPGHLLISGEVTSRDASYNSWLEEHPSALGSFYQMMKSAKGKKIVLFLDYDGTLSPIVDDPSCAFMSDEMRAAVHEVAKYFPTTIISGRSRDKVKEFVQLSNVYYAGSHGMDIKAPPRLVKSVDGKDQIVAHENENEVVFQPAKNFLPAIQKIKEALEEETMKIQGSRVEDNRFCISVHFRQVRAEDQEILEENVKSVLQHYPDFHFSWGKKVMEIRPSIEWDKGHALEYFLESLGFSNSSDVLPVYIGDDRTDEDAFKVISRRQGFPIIVSSSPKDTIARYSLHDPSEVLEFLLRLTRWNRSSFSCRSHAQI